MANGRFPNEKELATIAPSITHEIVEWVEVEQNSGVILITLSDSSPYNGSQITLVPQQTENGLVYACQSDSDKIVPAACRD